MKRLIVIAALCLAASSAFASGRHVSETGTQVGRYAPKVELTDLSGKNVTLESLRGSVVLLNFCSTLCSPCMAELPSLNRLYASFHDKGLQVLSVSVDQSDKSLREYAAKNNIGFTILLDKDREVFSGEYANPPLPLTFLIDQNGIIVEKFTGLEVWDAPEMKNRVGILLDRK